MGEFENIQRELAFALNGAQDLTEAMRLSLDAALEVADLDGGSFYVIDESTGESLLLYSKGLSDRFVSLVGRLPADDPRTILVMEAKPVYVRPDELSGGKDEGFEEEGLLAFAVIPLVHRGRVIGCLNLASKRYDKVSPEVRPNLESIAQQCGGVIARLKAEESLRASEARNRALLEALPDLMFLLNGDFVFTDYHTANPKSLLVPPEEFLGKSMYDVLPGDLADRFREKFERVLSGGGLEDLVYPLMMDGRERYFEARIVRCSEQNILIIIRDITERMRIQRIKDNIMRDLAHKLKTPLAMAQMGFNALTGAVSEDDEELRDKSLRMMENSVEQLMFDVDRILDYFQFTMRGERAPLGPLDLEKVVEDVFREERTMIGDGRIEFRVEIADDAREVMMDARDLHTLLSNLVGNAVKFTKEGSVTVSAESVGDMVRVIVSDTGMGIVPDIKDRVFESFFQGSAAYPGVGLGLSMCKEVIGRCEGEISIDSPGPGRGTRVRVDIPKSSSQRGVGES